MRLDTTEKQIDQLGIVQEFFLIWKNEKMVRRN